MRFNALLPTAAVTATAVLLLGTPVASVASPQPHQFVATDSLLDPVVASGHLVSATGAALANARISLLMWPSEDVRESALEGDAINLITVATGTSNSNGDFALRLPDVSALLAGLSDDGIDDFSLVASDSNGNLAHFAFSRSVLLRTVANKVRTLVVDPDDVGTNLIQTLLDSIGSLLSVVKPITGVLLKMGDGGSLANAPAIGDIVTDPDPSDPGVAEPTNAPEDGSMDSPLANDDDGSGVVEKGCYSLVEKNYAPKFTVIGYQGSVTPYAKMSFKYAQGSTTTFGVGFKASGSAWKVSGTSTSSKTSSNTTTAQQGFTAVTGYGYLTRRTEFKSAKFSIVCTDGMYGTSTWEEVRANGYAGGAATVKANAGNSPVAYRCVPEEAGGFWYQSSTKATTVSNGFDVSSYIGIDLSSQTGYNSSVESKFDFSHAAAMCGSNDYPGGVPKILVARPASAAN